jgi:hypothetical protein
MLETLHKDPGDESERDIEYADYLDSFGGGVVGTFAIEVESASDGDISGLELGPGSHPDYSIITDTRVKVWVGGGVSGTTYTLKATADLGSVGIWVDRFKVRVRNR